MYNSYFVSTWKHRFENLCAFHCLSPAPLVGTVSRKQVTHTSLIGSKITGAGSGCPLRTLRTLRVLRGYTLRVRCAARGMLREAKPLGSFLLARKVLD